MNTLVFSAIVAFCAPILSAIDTSAPEIWALGISLIYNLWQAIAKRNTRAALETVIDGVEHAARYENDAKRAVQLKAGSSVAKTVIDSVLVKKGYKKK